MGSSFALDQVMPVAKEQNLPILFNEGENSQVTTSFTLLTSTLVHANVNALVFTF